MLIFLATLLATLSSILRSSGCPGVGEPRPPTTNRRASAFRQQAPQVDSTVPCVVGLAVRHLSDWRSALAIVKPETVVAWHRAAFRLFWTWKVGVANPDDRSFPVSPRSDPQDVPRKPHLGCT